MSSVPGLRGRPLVPADHGQGLQRVESVQVLKAELTRSGCQQILVARPGLGEVAQFAEQLDAAWLAS